VVAEKSGVVSEELRKPHRNLFGPLGLTSPPATVEQAVAEYRIVRDRLECRWELSLPSRMGDEVAFALVRHGVM
jgi:hypothetical protein